MKKYRILVAADTQEHHRKMLEQAAPNAQFIYCNAKAVQQEDVQKAPEAPISEEPIVAEVPVEAPAEDPADAPTEPVTGSATEPSAAAVAVSGADDPTEAFTRIPHDAASEEPGAETPKN